MCLHGCIYSMEREFLFGSSAILESDLPPRLTRIRGVKGLTLYLGLRNECQI